VLRVLGPRVAMRRSDTAARRATASTVAERGVRIDAVNLGHESGRTCLYGAGAVRGRVGPARRPGVVRGTPGGDSALTSGPSAETETDRWDPAADLILK
jgi:hypothetical protein